MRKLFIGIAGLVLLGALGAFAGPPVMIVGSEGTDGIIYLRADDGDDAADKWSIHALASGGFAIKCNDTTAWTLGSNGAVTVVGSTVVPNTAKWTTTPVANVNVTNGQVVTLSGVINLLTGISKPNGATVTNTLANPSAAGQWAVLFNAAAATNSIAVSKAGNFVGPALSLGAGESAIIYAPSATTWAGLGQ